MKIYIASSARNLHGVQLLRNALTERGHQVLDWTALAPPLPEHLSPEERRMALDSDERGEIFDFCAQACTSAQALIYFGPAGQDAACEVGMAFAAGVPTIGLAAPTEKPGLILGRAVRFWAADINACLKAIETLDTPTHSLAGGGSRRPQSLIIPKNDSGVTSSTRPRESTSTVVRQVIWE